MILYRLKLYRLVLLLCILVSNSLFQILSDFPTEMRQEHRLLNYPVQGLAGGCVVPLALNSYKTRLQIKRVASKIINAVHDSVVLDVYPGEEEVVARMTYDAMTKVDKQFEEQYNVSWQVPLAVDLEIGKDWLNMKEYNLTNSTECNIN